MTPARIIRRLDHHGYGTDRYELRCGCGRVIVRSHKGVEVAREEGYFLLCGRCAAAVVAALVAERHAEPTAGGVA